jgi:peptidyl-prolyl cis-trans isomerase D
MRKHAQSWLIKVTLFSVAIVFIFWGVGSYRSEKATLVAKVNKTGITLPEFQKAHQQMIDKIKQAYGRQVDDKTLYSKEFKTKVLDDLIDKKLLQAMGKELGFSLTPEELARAIQGSPHFQENGKFSLYRYKKILQMNRMTPEGFEADEAVALLEERVKAFLNGFIKIEPEEVRTFYSFLNDETKVSVLLFKKDDYKKQASVTPDQVKTFFSQNQSRYQTPLQIKVAYLDIQPKDFEAKVVITEKEIREYYQQNQKLFTDPKKDKPLPLDKVQEKVRNRIKEQKARELALQKAEELYDQVLSKGNLKVFGRDAKVSIKETEWMTSGQQGSGIEAAKEFNQKAFSVKKGELTPVVDLNPQWGFVIMQVTERKESQAMTLAQAESRVKEDYIEDKAAQMALADAEASLKSLRQSKDFQQWAKEKNRKWEETGFFSRIKGFPAWAKTQEVMEILLSIGSSHPLPEKPLKLGSDFGIIAFKESRRASMEDFTKDQERFTQALQQQKRASILEQWSRLLREKAKISINQDLI